MHAVDPADRSAGDELPSPPNGDRPEAAHHDDGGTSMQPSPAVDPRFRSLGENVVATFILACREIGKQCQQPWVLLDDSINVRLRTSETKGSDLMNAKSFRYNRSMAGLQCRRIELYCLGVWLPALTPRSASANAPVPVIAPHGETLKI